MRLCRSLAAVFGGLALVTTTAAGVAVASNGTFIWQGPKGKAYSVANPPDNKCFNMAQTARAPRNHLKQPLALYSGKKCKGHKVTLRPGQTAPNNTRFASVRFNPR